MRLLISLFFLALLVTPLGIAHADSKSERFWKLMSKHEHKSGTTSTGLANAATRRAKAKGGIDPATFPVIDGDFMMMSLFTGYQLQTHVAHQRATGRGVVVAVLDGGFDLEHPELMGRMTPYGFDAIDNDFDPHDIGNGFDDDWDGIPDRGVGHGTFVAGMVLFAAPEATVVPIRVRDDEGWGTTRELLRGLRWAWYLGVDIINLSLSAEAGQEPAVLDLIREIHDSGVAVVVSAGNDGGPEASELGRHGTALTVAAVTIGDRLAPFSNYMPEGNAMTVCAPGVDLYGPMDSPWGPENGYWSGTSFAAGLVSGALALVRELDPGRPSWELYHHVMESVDPAWGRDGEPLPTGRINLAKVVE